MGMTTPNSPASVQGIGYVETKPQHFFCHVCKKKHFSRGFSTPTLNGITACAVERVS